MGSVAACLVVLSPVLALGRVSGSGCAGMAMKLVRPCMRSRCVGWRLCRAALQELGVLLIVPPGRAFPGTDALDEALRLLLLKFPGGLCRTIWRVSSCYAPDNVLNAPAAFTRG